MNQIIDENTPEDDDGNPIYWPRQKTEMSNEWRDISTAPKDGTIVDLWIVKTNVPEGDPADPERWPDCHYSKEASDWVNNSGMPFSIYMATMTPTHWMSTPQPPKEGE